MAEETKEMNAADLIDHISRMKSVEKLQALREEEIAGKGRVTVVAAIDNRIAHLELPENQELPPGSDAGADPLANPPETDPASQPPATPSGAPPPSAPAQPTTCELVLNCEAALGEGTRQKGFVIATAERDGDSYWPETVVRAEGVTPRELANALLNPQYLEIRSI
jgi:hypothetical protein